MQSKFSSRAAVTIFETVTVTARRFGAAIVVFLRATHGVYICLFVYKSSRATAFHTKLYVSDIKSVKMLERLLKVYYTIFYIGGYNNDF